MIEDSAGMVPMLTTLPVPTAWIQRVDDNAIPTWLIVVLPRVDNNTRSPGRIDSVRTSTALPCRACCAALW